VESIGLRSWIKERERLRLHRLEAVLWIGAPFNAQSKQAKA